MPWKFLSEGPDDDFDGDTVMLIKIDPDEAEHWMKGEDVDVYSVQADAEEN